ncbi:hypothetical protein K443DRAFT_108330 [Laccaria amethystina LaAM-08-1]|uniref:Uncharacterized protein n=1 Tax=Laccaria amethystina LaAM-08-1 TaxID=1095629 RepID=A0A0C9WU72_9AGAR|nr:hypothetical protein K443DRAFT_108330 [Laccaria amethystina LaAM-08-1]
MAKLFLITTYRRGALSEDLTAHPTVTMAIDCVVAAAVQISAAVQTPFLTLCNASMGHHLPSSIRILKYLEILRPPGLHTKSISEQSGIEASKLIHILRLFATRHILREVTSAVFATNRISSLIQARAPKSCQSSKQLKYNHTNGIAVFVGLCEIQKASAYITETYLISPSKQTCEGREPTRAPLCFAFGALESQTDFFGWLEGKADLTLQEASKGR